MTRAQVRLTSKFACKFLIGADEKPVFIYIKSTDRHFTCTQHAHTAGTLTRSDMEVESRTWTTCIVGKVSEWLADPLSSADPALRLAGEVALKQVRPSVSCHVLCWSPRIWIFFCSPLLTFPPHTYRTFQELAWASHLAVPAVMLPSPPASSSCANYARILHQAVSQPCILQLWCRVPLVARAAVDEEEEEAEEQQDGSTAEAKMEEEDDGNGGEGPLRALSPVPPSREDPWESWDRLRTLCEFDASLGVALGAWVREGGGRAEAGG